eukprot:TRINITY_DN410_c0_g1_i1.p1 TRINITY_DN410_c0_g1~~TRINITY_DN410_c0_g1_i1.p1  ORF type:complete len:474 (-),score=146.41 TRINITY_DN410_c0_g1_i1:269-1690(-)
MTDSLVEVPWLPLYARPSEMQGLEETSQRALFYIKVVMTAESYRLLVTDMKTVWSRYSYGPTLSAEKEKFQHHIESDMSELLRLIRLAVLDDTMRLGSPLVEDKDHAKGRVRLLHSLSRTSSSLVSSSEDSQGSTSTTSLSSNATSSIDSGGGAGASIDGFEFEFTPRHKHHPDRLSLRLERKLEQFYNLSWTFECDSLEVHNNTISEGRTDGRGLGKIKLRDGEDGSDDDAVFHSSASFLQEHMIIPMMRLNVLAMDEMAEMRALLNLKDAQIHDFTKTKGLTHSPGVRSTHPFDEQVWLNRITSEKIMDTLLDVAPLPFIADATSEKMFESHANAVQRQERKRKQQQQQQQQQQLRRLGSRGASTGASLGVSSSLPGGVAASGGSSSGSSSLSGGGRPAKRKAPTDSQDEFSSSEPDPFASSSASQESSQGGSSSQDQEAERKRAEALEEKLKKKKALANKKKKRRKGGLI